MTGRQPSAGPDEAQHFGVSGRGIVRITVSTHAGSGQDSYSTHIQLASSKECSAAEGTARKKCGTSKRFNKKCFRLNAFLEIDPNYRPLYLPVPEEARIHTAAAITGTASMNRDYITFAGSDSLAQGRLNKQK